MKKNQLIMIGRISGAHGIRGELKVLPLTDDPARYFDLDEVILVHKETMTKYAITHCRLHQSKVLISLEGITDRNQVEACIGDYVGIPRELAVPLATDEFFVEELIGLPVYNEGELLGKITHILQTGGVDVYMISDGKKTYAVPARKCYFKEINVADNRIDASIPSEILVL